MSLVLISWSRRDERIFDLFLLAYYFQKVLSYLFHIRYIVVSISGLRERSRIRLSCFESFVYDIFSLWDVIRIYLGFYRMRRLGFLCLEDSSIIFKKIYKTLVFGNTITKVILKVGGSGGYGA